jgi:hypothetical protein
MFRRHLNAGSWSPSDKARGQPIGTGSSKKRAREQAKLELRILPAKSGSTIRRHGGSTVVYSALGRLSLYMSLEEGSAPRLPFRTAIKNGTVLEITYTATLGEDDGPYFACGW